MAVVDNQRSATTTNSTTLLAVNVVLWAKPHPDTRVAKFPWPNGPFSPCVQVGRATENVGGAHGVISIAVYMQMVNAAVAILLSG